LIGRLRFRPVSIQRNQPDTARPVIQTKNIPAKLREVIDSR